MTHLPNGDDSFENQPTTFRSIDKQSENGDSTSSELERLDNVSPCPSGADSPTERGIAKTKKKEELILRLIGEATALGTNTLDLSNKGMRQFPSEILEMPQLEYLYLESNELTVLPDEFFDKLPNLRWLDLRRNYLVRMPAVYTGRHQNLRNLLLEGNNLRSLPLELGLIKTLNGLNITNNPLEFPPQCVIEKGTSEILKFLREMIQAKSAGKLANGKKKKAKLKRHKSYTAGVPSPSLAGPTPALPAGITQRATSSVRRSASISNLKAHSARLASQQFPLQEDPREEDPSIEYPPPQALEEDILDDGSSSSDDDWDNDDGDLREYAYQRVRDRSLSVEAAKRAASGQMALINKSAELHRPVSYTAIKQSKTEKIKKAGAMGTIPRKPQSATSVLNWKVNQYPEPPGPEYVNDRAKEERRLAKDKEFKEKTDAILQRRKDEEMLKDWRVESRRLQQKKYFESLRKGTKDFLDPVRQAPFDIDEDHIKVPTNAERIKQDIKNAHEKIRRPMSPGSRQRIEEEKAQRILQLEKRIKAHTSSMHERRKLPKGTPQEEMEAARKELEVAEALHRELMARRKEMEYRFKAFVAEMPASSSYQRTQTLKRKA